MSWWISLTDPVSGEILDADQPHLMQGGTLCIGGTTELTLNVTYNYGRHFKFRDLHGMTGLESVEVLGAASAMLGDDADDDYWKPTEGNTKRAILQLSAMAKMRPDGVWLVN